MAGINSAFLDVDQYPQIQRADVAVKNEKRLLVVLLNNLQSKKLTRDVW